MPFRTFPQADQSQCCTAQEIVAVCRPSSLGKPQIDLFKKNGVKVVGLEITGPREPLVDVIKGADTVIAALNFLVLEQQTILIDVCKEAGVGRFIPDNFGPVMPPVGAMALRERVSWSLV